jgi:hypothetical protein
MAFGTPTVFIQIWVDSNAVQNGSSRGIYLVDNRVGFGSNNEGSSSLATNVTQNSVIQWSAFNIDPNSPDTVQLSAISNAPIWGASGQPQSDGQGNFIGQAQSDGGSGYDVTLTVQQGGGSGITLHVDPSMSVQ